MRQRTWLHAILLSSACFGTMFMFRVSIASPAGSSAIAAVRTPKCTIEIAPGQESDCTLIKANHEWILWSNSSSKLRSIHFKSDDNPFTESSCWDIEPGARARSGPVALNAVPRAYVSYTSGVPCASNPPSDTSRGTSKVIIQ
jgi:hypothetical protein